MTRNVGAWLHLYISSCKNTANFSNYNAVGLTFFIKKMLNLRIFFALLFCTYQLMA